MWQILWTMIIVFTIKCQAFYEPKDPALPLPSTHGPHHQVTRSSTVNSRSGHASGLKRCGTSGKWGSYFLTQTYTPEVWEFAPEKLPYHHLSRYPERVRHPHSLQTYITPTRKLRSSNLKFASATIVLPWTNSWTTSSSQIQTNFPFEDTRAFPLRTRSYTYINSARRRDRCSWKLLNLGGSPQLARLKREQQFSPVHSRKKITTNCLELKWNWSGEVEVEEYKYQCHLFTQAFSLPSTCHGSGDIEGEVVAQKLFMVHHPIFHKSLFYHFCTALHPSSLNRFLLPQRVVKVS